MVCNNYFLKCMVIIRQLCIVIIMVITRKYIDENVLNSMLGVEFRYTLSDKIEYISSDTL